MKFLLIFALAVACLKGITSLAADLGDMGSSRKLPEPEQGKKKAEEDLLIDRVGNTANHAAIIDSQESKLGSSDKEAGKAIVKQNAEEKNTIAAAAGAQVTDIQQNLARAPTKKTEDGKNGDTVRGRTYDYTNVLAVLSGGGLLSVAKVIQSIFAKKKSKKEKKKNGKSEKRDSEASDSDSEAEPAAKPTHVTLQIELKTQHNTDTVVPAPASTHLVALRPAHPVALSPAHPVA